MKMLSLLNDRLQIISIVAVLVCLSGYKLPHSNLEISSLCITKCSYKIYSILLMSSTKVCIRGLLTPL